MVQEEKTEIENLSENISFEIQDNAIVIRGVIKDDPRS